MRKSIFILSLAVLQFTMVFAQDYTLSESFEDWDGEANDWLPEGWIAQKTEGLSNYYNSWYVSAQANSATPAPPDGQYYAEIIYSNKDAQDEWLISPSFTPKGGETLTFQLGTIPFNLFNWDSKYFDWTTKTFKEKISTADLQVMVSIDGGEWEKAMSLFEEFSQYTDEDLYKNHRTFAFNSESVDLGLYANKSIRVAFRYVGKEGDSMFLDDVKVSLPPISVSYSTPLAGLNWVRGEDFDYPLDYGVHIYPPYTTVNYTNLCEDSDASFLWESKSITGGNETTATTKDFNVTYKPDYNDGEFQQFYYAPTVTASKEGSQSTSYIDETYPLVMIGGKPEIDGYKFGVSNYRLDDDYRILTEEFDGIQAIPRYGYGPGSDAYWTADFANGNELAPDEYKHMIAACNYFLKPDKPYIINGGWIHAYGEVDDDAEFIVYINELTEIGEVIEDRVRTDTIYGRDLIREYPDGKGMITIPFHFDEPYVQSTGIILCITGFRDPEHVKWLAFYQTKTQRAGTAIALMEVNYNNDGGLNYSYHHVGHDDDPLGGYCHNNFLFSLDAEFPWLESMEGYNIVLEDGETDKDIHLDSSWDASELELKLLPSWVTANVEGKYDNTLLHISATEATKKRVSSFYLASGAIFKKFSITQMPTTGIAEVECDTDTDRHIYTLGGVEVKEPMQKGLYIENGRKIIAK